MKRILLGIVMLVLSSLALAAVNINTATKEELDALPGVGPVKAQAIIDYRKANGPFRSLDDLKKVDGIGDATFDKLKPDISLTGKTTPVAASAKAESAKDEKAAKAKADSDVKAKEKADAAARERADKDTKAKAMVDKDAKAKADADAKAKAKSDAAAKDAKAKDATAKGAKDAKAVEAPKK